ncbi:prepilin-type N-terminal cleavage/methylation domain-containing protein [bacterium]|nr:prepilin-type N-terminal cleavage/methylation domain-containing protein [bacterium]
MRRGGFTLLEILATIAIATVMIGPIFYMLSAGTRYVYKSSDKTYAVLVAADLIEVVRGTDFKVLPPRKEAYSVDEIRDLISSGDNLRRNLYFSHVYEDDFKVGAFVQDLPNPESLGEMVRISKLRMVTVVVVWKSKMNEKEDEVRLTSFYTEHQSG